MKRVISCCLYGRDPFYVEGAIINAIEAKDYYPGWEFWLYVNQGHVALPRLRNIPGIKLIEQPVCKFSEGMCWRFKPDLDPDVERVIYRDVDCRFSDREVSAVDEWVKSRKLAHLMFESLHNGMNGNKVHSHILGGLWGLRTGVLHLWDEYQKWLLEYRLLGYGADQQFLSQVVWPRIKDDVIVHCENSQEKEDQLRSIGIEPRAYPVGGYTVGNKVPVWDSASYFPGPLDPAAKWLVSRGTEISDSDLVGAIYSMEQLIKMLGILGERYYIAQLAAYNDMAALQTEARKREIHLGSMSTPPQFAYAQRVSVRKRR